ncbi:Uncharacterised protein [Yersinia bercovieri]|nr:Uncharacterised protein [Yersinia bercovieri]
MTNASRSEARLTIFDSPHEQQEVMLISLPMYGCVQWV